MPAQDATAGAVRSISMLNRIGLVTGLPIIRSRCRSRAGRSILTCSCPYPSLSRIAGAIRGEMTAARRGESTTRLSRS